MLNSSISSQIQGSLQNYYLFLVEVVEDALQHIKMYITGISDKTAKGYFRNVEEYVTRPQGIVNGGLEQF